MDNQTNNRVFSINIDNIQGERAEAFIKEIMGNMKKDTVDDANMLKYQAHFRYFDESNRVKFLTGCVIFGTIADRNNYVRMMKSRFEDESFMFETENNDVYVIPSVYARCGELVIKEVV